MSKTVVVCCPTCRQKYKVGMEVVGRHARCKKCATQFLVVSEQPIDDDSIVAWIMEGSDPSSKSVMGSTGIFDHDTPDPAFKAPAPPPVLPGQAAVKSAVLVRLTNIDSTGAHFSFPAMYLSSEDLRSAFPRRCVGCNARSDLQVHLLYWPERFSIHDPAHVAQRMDKPLGWLNDYREPQTPALLKQLPHTSHMREPFTLPFPVFACEFCHVAREVEGHVVAGSHGDLCQLRIQSLNVAVEFFRNAGGRSTSEYRKLIEQRDLSHDPWRELTPPVRQRLSSWLQLTQGEGFLGYYPDAGSSGKDEGVGGTVLTTQRIVVCRSGARKEYSLAESGRLEVMAHGDEASVHIYEPGHPPAVLRLDRRNADDLAGALRRVQSRWSVLV